MGLTADIQYTILKPSQVYTSALTPVSAMPWHQRGDSRSFPLIPVNYDKNNVVWDFGDGTTYTGISASHIYTWPGTYTISMYIVNDNGEPVKSTVTDTVIVHDFISTQFEYTNIKDVIDIPIGSVTNPIQLNFTLSWQNFNIPNRPAPTCPDEIQHWMNPGAEPGYWMCGNEHTDHTETLPPIYTFSLYASGSNAQPADIEQYSRYKYSHLEPLWYFTSADPETNTVPVTSINVTQLDALTGTTGDYNTYELIYYANINNEYVQVKPDTPGSVFVGVSGNMTYHYIDNRPKVKTSNDQPVIISAQLDSIKLHDNQTIRGEDLPVVKHSNTQCMTLSNVKPRVNIPSGLGITCNGLNDFQINKNKWSGGDIFFTVTVHDDESFNILDSTVIDENNLDITLRDSYGYPVDSSLYTIKMVNNGLGYYQGILNVNTVVDDVNIHGNLTYIPVSGYTNDAIVAWFNSYSSTDAYGEVHRLYYKEVTEFDNDKLSDNITITHQKNSINIKTSGIVSDITLTSGGAGMLAQPLATMTGPGSGVRLDCVFENLTNNISSVNVVAGGVGYDSTSTVDFEVFPTAATKPVINTITLEDNNQTSLVAVSLEDVHTSQHAWMVETGTVPRLVRVDTRQVVETVALTDYEASTTGNNSILLDSNKDVWVLTDNYLLHIDKIDKTLLGSYTTTSTCFDIDDQYIYLGSLKTLTKNPTNTPTTNIASVICTGDIQTILHTGNNKLYIHTANNTIDVVDTNTMTIDTTISLTPGTYTQMTTTIDNNVYICTTSGVLYRITQANTVETLYNLSTTINTICGDSRGYIWLSDTAGKRIWLIDANGTTTSDLQINNDATTLKKLHVNYTNYPTGFNTDHQLQSRGDYTGFHWLRKFGYLNQEQVTLTGASTKFNVYPSTGKYQIRKQNEQHDHVNMLKSYALQPWLKDNYNLWDNTLSYALGDANASPTQIGKQYHEKIANFVSNNSDIDDSNIDAIHSETVLYSLPIQTYNLDYPPSFLRLFNIITIKHKRLFGEIDQLTDNFDKFTDYTNPLRENLGEELDILTYTLTVGETIVALEKFSQNYTKITVSVPTTGSIDANDNIVQLSTDTNALTGDKFNFRYYNVFWNWGLIAPVSTTGEDLSNYYSFYKYNPSTKNQQVEGVINWTDPQNTLDQTDDTYNNWSKDTGIMDNMIEHQLRVGLGIV